MPLMIVAAINQYCNDDSFVIYMYMIKAEFLLVFYIQFTRI